MAFRFIAFLACIVILASFVAAHEGHDHHHMAPGPAPITSRPPPSAALDSSPSLVVGILAMAVTFLGVIGKWI
ncbi:hypothetical protein CASFOL_009711 [Castilleja foliolosa]|uniref:Transmembrane protein n=1 Tax=Castilleja foliolosa TaxID=1961234 RepID=A0ABD3DUK8_9LAMI